MFFQAHRPGEACQVDFTETASLRVELLPSRRGSAPIEVIPVADHRPPRFVQTNHLDAKVTWAPQYPVEARRRSATATPTAMPTATPTVSGGLRPAAAGRLQTDERIGKQKALEPSRAPERSTTEPGPAPRATSPCRSRAAGRGSKEEAPGLVAFASESEGF